MSDYSKARIEPQAERLLLTGIVLEPHQIRRNQLWVAADGSGIVAVIDGVEDDEVFYTINGQSFNKDAHHFQIRYCLSILGN